ncbi:hypothetical protein IFR05_001728 [Cadophora sp. M221]|nr:hypothetical protein IFR05_001728 [Cadophora sp. M221]
MATLPQNPSRAPPTSTTPSTSANESAKDTIEVAVLGDPGCGSDHEMEDSPAPPFANSMLTGGEGDRGN